MAAESRMSLPYFVRDSRRLQMQRPRLEQFEAGVVLGPLDFDREVHDLLNLPQQATQLHGLRGIQAWLGRPRAEKRTHAVSAADAMRGPPGHRLAQRAIAAEDEAVRYHLALGNR